MWVNGSRSTSPSSARSPAIWNQVPLPKAKAVKFLSFWLTKTTSGSFGAMRLRSSGVSFFFTESASPVRLTASFLNGGLPLSTSSTASTMPGLSGSTDSTVTVKMYCDSLSTPPSGVGAVIERPRRPHAGQQ